MSATEEPTVTARVAKSGWSHRIADPETGEEKVVHQIGLAVHSYQLDDEANGG